MINSKTGTELIGTNFIVETTIHKGKNSSVYKCHKKDSPNHPLCAKYKLIKEQDDSVEKELKLLQKLTGITPPLCSYIRTTEAHIIIMEYMGPSLYEHFESLNRKFSLNTIALIGLNILKVLEELHAEGYVHGHLSPKKIITERDPLKNFLYFVGLSSVKKYRNDKGEHIRFKEHKNPSQIYSAFASINANMGIRLARRDDIESLAYILLYFDTRGEIFDHKPKGQDLIKWKTSTPPELMHKKASLEFVQILNYARNLKYEEKPNYEKVEKVLKNVLSKGSNKLPLDQMKYDWSSKSGQNISENQASEKRKALSNLEKGIPVSSSEKFIRGGKHFPTILEDSTEDIQSCIMEKVPSFRDEFDLTKSPQLTGHYNELQDTPKLDAVNQPTLKNRIMVVPNTNNVQSSPWNCSEGMEDRESIRDKVRSLDFKVAMGIN